MGDIDNILELWEHSINLLHDNTTKWNDAELEYESQLAYAMKQQEHVSTSKDLARGEEKVIIAKKELQKWQRAVQAGKAKIVFLEAKYNWHKMKWRSESQITGADK